MKLVVYKCLVCDSQRPCILSNLTEDDDIPSLCPLNAEKSNWFLDIEEVEPYDAKEAYADHKLECDKDAKLLAKVML